MSLCFVLFFHSKKLLNFVYSRIGGLGKIEMSDKQRHDLAKCYVILMNYYAGIKNDHYETKMKH